MGLGVGVSDGAAVGDGVEVTVGDKVAVGEFATGVDFGVCAVGVDVAARSVVGAAGVSVSVLAGAVGVETLGSLSPGRSITDRATV